MSIVPEPYKSSDSLRELTERLRSFADARDWEQFHSPKNLAMALASEAGELLALFRWLREDETRQLAADQMEKVRGELADILNFTVRLADQLGIDLPDAAHEKVTLNETRYPVAKARGTAKKYDEL
jgi:NTP pyrophosphatase (non-canonical NTP hydrolase)